MSRTIRSLALLATLGVVAGLAACDDASSASGDSDTIRVGYFPNITHATALVGDREGLFQDAVGDDVDIEVSTFDTGTEATEALFSEALDISYIGPSPALSAWTESEGEAIRLIAGAASGGAALVVSDDITTPADLAGKKIASPSLGNTQDVALRSYLLDEGFETTLEGGGDVEIIPQENSTTLQTFQTGDIDGAWVPEPWATRLVEEGGGTVLVDEADLWPEGQFVTTHVIVRTAFLEDHPDLVKAFLEGHLAATNFVNENPDAAQAAAIEQIFEITDSELSPEIIAAAWANLEFTLDPIASSLAENAADAEAVELLDPIDLDGIYELELLNEILADQGLPPVEGL